MKVVKLVALVLLAVGIYVLFVDPVGAAKAVQIGLGGLKDAAIAIGAFVKGLFS